MPYADPEDKRRSDKAYREANLEKLNAQTRERYTNPEVKAARQASNENWRKNNLGKVRAANAKWKAANPDKVDQNVVSRRFAKFGMTVEEAKAHLIAQDSACLICRKDLRWGERRTHADHDHRTGRFRGFLCAPCNQRLGVLENAEFNVRAGAFLSRAAGGADFIETNSGREFHILGDDASEVCIEDIAAALSKLCRYTGQGCGFLSVAEHSVGVSLLVPPDKALGALLHDASEAYLNDISTPVKRLLPQYKHLERRVQGRIARKFGLPEGFDTDADIHAADRLMLQAEAAVLLPSGGRGWGFVGAPVTLVSIECLAPEAAKKVFLERFHSL